MAAVVLFAAFSETLGAQVVNSIVRGGDAVSAGFSGAGVALPANAYAMENNPAAMSLYDGTMSAAAGYSLFQPSSVKMQLISLAGFYKIMPELAVGIQAGRLGYTPYKTVSADGYSSGEFTPSEIAVAAGASYQVMEGLSVGASAKIFSLSLAEGSKTSGFCLDLAAMYQLGDLTAGLNVKNLASDFMDITAGASYGIASFTASVQAEYLAGAGFMAGLGAQYSFKDMVFARAGFHYGDATKAIPSYASLGVGAKFAGITLDAAYIIGNANVSGTLQATIGYSF